MPPDLLVLLLDQPLNRARRLQGVLVVLADLPLQLLLLQLTNIVYQVVNRKNIERW